MLRKFAGRRGRSSLHALERKKSCISKNARMIVAACGFVSKINFFKLRRWSRTAHEILTWLLFVFVAIFGGLAVYQLIATSSPHASFGFAIMEVAINGGILGICGVFLVIMVICFRGNKVRAAIARCFDPDTAADSLTILLFALQLRAVFGHQGSR